MKGTASIDTDREQLYFFDQLYGGHLGTLNLVRGGKVDRYLRRHSFWKQPMATYSPFNRVDPATGEPVCRGWGQDEVPEDIDMASIEAFIESLARIASMIPECGFTLRLYDIQFLEEIERGDWDL